MANTYKKLFGGYVLSAASAHYAVPAATTAIIRHWRIVNISSTDVSAKLWQCGSADVNVTLPPLSIPAGGHISFDGIIILPATETFQAQAQQTSALILWIYGDEVT